MKYKYVQDEYSTQETGTYMERLQWSAVSQACSVPQLPYCHGQAGGS